MELLAMPDSELVGWQMKKFVVCFFLLEKGFFVCLKQKI